MASEPSTTEVHTWRARVQRIHQDETGQVSLVVAVIVLGLAVACCFLGNIAERIHEKIEVQNAADAAAYSNAVWAARGMNAITTTNHLIGELTALCVIQESLGAQGVERGGRSETAPFETQVSTDLSKAIMDKKNAHHPSGGLKDNGITIASQTIGKIEERLVPQLAELLARDSAGQGRHVGGAAMYDSMIQVKRLADSILTLKKALRKISLAINAVALVPFLRPYMEVLDGVVAAAQIGADKFLIDLSKEKVFLIAFDRSLELLGNFKIPVRQVLIPALSQYADSLVGAPGGAASSLLQTPIAKAQEKTLKVTKNYYRMTALDQNVPAARFRLPLVPEPLLPPEDEQTIEFDVTWSGENMSERASMRLLLRTFDPILDALEPIKEGFEWAELFLDSLGGVGGALDAVGDLLGEVSDDAKKLIDEAKGWLEVGDLLSAAEDFLNWKLPRTRAPDLFPFPENPTCESFKSSENQIDIEQEEFSQWVRATYPYVDSYRAPLRNFFDRSVPNSCLRTYFTHWTNRFTLIECYLRRREDASGNFQDNSEENKGNSQAQKQKQTLTEFNQRLNPVRNRFSQLSGAVDLEELSDSVEVLRQIGNDFPPIANWLRSSGGATILKSAGIPIGEWMDAAATMSRNARETGANATYDPTSGLNEAEYRDAVEAIALQQSVDELLTGFEGLDELVDFLNPFGPPKLYVIRDCEPPLKGNEPWTTNEQLADRYFTLLVGARRNPQPSTFGPGLFQNPNEQGTIGFGQALFYNANGRHLDAEPNGLTQPNTGWDTLNWEPPVKAPEWRQGTPSESSSGGSLSGFPWTWKIPTDVFTGRDSLRSARVALNWQSKLVPLTKRRLFDFQKTVEDKPLKTAADFLRNQPDQLISH